ncbi:MULTISPECIES: hypothetical protein [unclassified Shewanella]|uniref:hypothetical protein n=1 Tax=Shewanella TaxID=22 RepID=UPI0021DA291C|nr:MULTISPECIES: hypothetical protein [unclassified Shewanella]MCU8003942.1 hypothetical protein [Shewanella sp. SM96]MCU8029312.1 hypothetical protein [Shewanella sp. SM73]
MKSAYKVFLAGLCSLLLSACGGGGSISDDGGGTTPKPSVVTVTMGISNTEISAIAPAEVTAKVVDSKLGPLAGILVTFSLNDSNIGSFSPSIGTDLTGVDGVARMQLVTATIAGAGTVTAKVDSGESGKIGFKMKGDGGVAGGGAQVSLVLTDSNGSPLKSISTLLPGKLVATVTGISKPTIVTFSSPIGDLPIKTAVTNDQGKATVDIYAGSALGAGEVTASLASGELGNTIVVVGATNVVMGSGVPFVKGQAAISSTTVSAGGTASISVLIQDDLGNPFTQPVDVNFSSTCATKIPAQAQISSPVSSSNGVATSTYLAQGCVGEDQINVTANAGGISLSAVGKINVLRSEIGSIVFVSAIPENISILGTGGIESSVVKFRVLDKNGNFVSNQNVKFNLNTGVGGVKLAPLEATTNNEGLVQTVVTTGTVATSLRVTATVDDNSIPAISSQSSQLIISTGIPDQDSLSLSAEVLNAEGWNRDGTEVLVTARLADAFNNPVPNGTTVSFTTEGGSIEDACQTIKGACSVKWTSQLPRPEGKVIIDGAGEMILNPKADMVEYPALGVYGNFYGQKYGGRATITATAIGEESFPDLNGNGRFDASEMTTFLTGKDVTGQSFDLNDAFNDYNEDGIFNPQQASGQLGGELEELIDFNSNGVFDVKDDKYNGVLCSDPVHAGCADGISQSKSLYVRRSIVMVMSGSTAYATDKRDVKIIDQEKVPAVDADGKPITVIVANEHLGGAVQIFGKGVASVSFTISDVHNQQMPAGSIVSFTTSAGSVTSSSQYTWPSSNHNGGRDFTVSLKGEDKPNSGTLLVTVTTPNNTVTEVLSIAVNIL